MKRRIISLAVAGATLIGSFIGVYGGNAAEQIPVLSGRSTIEITDGRVKGIAGLVNADWLEGQFDGDVAVISDEGVTLSGDDAVSSESVVMVGETVIAEVIVPGDVAKDGKINLSDVTAMLKYIAKWNIDAAEATLDVNRDGGVNLSDVSVLLKYIAKWDVYFFDDKVMLPVFKKGRTAYKLLANDLAIDSEIVTRIKALTGIEMEIVTEKNGSDPIITVGKNLFEKYSFINENAVTDGVYVDTYGGDIYLTSATDEGVEKCVEYLTYGMLSPELDAEIEKGTAGVVDIPDVTYTDIVKDGSLAYTLIRPEVTSETVAEGSDIIRDSLKERFDSKYYVYVDDDGKKELMGEFDSEYEEVLIGQTNRRESKDACMTLSPGEYTIRTVGNKLVVIGYNDYLTYLAAKDLSENVLLYAKDNSFSIPADFNVVKKPFGDFHVVKNNVENEDIIPVGDKIEITAERWLANEIEFTSDKDYTDPVYTMDMDVVFHNKDTGTAYVVPAFWDGGRTFKVRFALTETGEWEFYTKCSDTTNDGLHHRYGSVICTEYSGGIELYKHGFVTTKPGTNYFVYADGTPFFYLADTHWTLALEELDSYGSVETQASAGITAELAEEYGVTSQFRYIMDYRAEQGYTVIQSQPLGWWTFPGQNSWFADDFGNIYTYGVNDLMLEKFQQYDEYFSYIAQLGLVHANSQLSSVSALMTEYFAGNIDEDKLEKLCRYWVARYSAYPVMWTTAQEADNDYYGEDRGDCEATPDNNPWHYVIDFVHKYDPYAHPSTSHQEHWSYTNASNSSFDEKDAHTWYAAQYYLHLKTEDPANWQRFRDYYGNAGSKPVVNYEGRYDHFWVGTYGARAQGWQAFMNGHVGYGYGVQPIWSIFWSGVEGLDDSSDEWETYNRDDNWIEGLYAEGGRQVAYMKRFLEEYEWWRLVPCFDGSYYYKPNGTGYSVCSIGNELYLGYFYGTNKNYNGLGTLLSMKNGDYNVIWFNCRTGESEEAFTVTVTDGKYKIPKKPGDGDWVISVEWAG